MNLQSLDQVRCKLKLLHKRGGRHSSVQPSVPTIPQAQSSNPKYNFYTFFQFGIEKDENKQKEAGIGPYLIVYTNLLYTYLFTAAWLYQIRAKW